MRRSRHTTHSRRGMTLIEVVVVISLMAVLLLVSLPSLKAATGAHVRQAGRELAPTLRYTYQEAILTNTPMRLAYNLDQNTWWIEAADGDAVIFRDRDEREAFGEFMARKAESDERVRERAEASRSAGKTQQQIMQEVLGEAGDEGGAGGMGMLNGLLGGMGISPVERGGEFQPNEFRPYGGEGKLDDDAFQLRKLPSGVRFMGVWTPQYGETVKPMDEFDAASMAKEESEDQQWTIIYTHAFPGGYLEDTVIYLSDEDEDTVMSLIIEPLLGRVELVYDVVEPPDLRDREQR